MQIKTKITMENVIFSRKVAFTKHQVQEEIFINVHARKLTQQLK